MTTVERTEDRSKRTTLWYDLVLDDQHPAPDDLRARFPYSPGRPPSRRRPLHQPRLAPARARAPVAQGLADGVPRGEHPRGRQLHALRDRRRLVPRGPHPRRHQGLRQRLPAPRPRAQGLRRPVQRVPLQLPRLHLAPRRHPALHARRRRSSPRSRPTATRGGCPRPRSGTWGGFVFINPDPDAEPLEDFLGTLPEHFARWDFEHRYLQAHVAKKIRCNWKVAQEAFDEGLHLGAHASAVGAVRRRRQRRGRCVRQLRAADQPVRHADRGPPGRRQREPTSSSGCSTCARARTCRSRSRSADRPRRDGRGGPGALAAGARRRGRRHLRRRAGRPLELRGLPELPPVGRLQPDRLPVPAQRRPARRVRSSRSCS